jgi:hypothetical protein
VGEVNWNGIFIFVATNAAKTILQTQIGTSIALYVRSRAGM